MGFWSLKASPPPKRSYLLILTKEFHQLGIKYSSIWANGYHSHSNHHSEAPWVLKGCKGRLPLCLYPASDFFRHHHGASLSLSTGLRGRAMSWEKGERRPGKWDGALMASPHWRCALLVWSPWTQGAFFRSLTRQDGTASACRGCGFQTDAPAGPCPTSAHCWKLLGRFSFPLLWLVFLCLKSSGFLAHLHRR